jgi:hypothetical protein
VEGDAPARAGRYPAIWSLYFCLNASSDSHAAGQARLFDEEDRNAVADGVGEAADLGDEEIALLSQPAVRQRAAEDLEEFGVDRVGRVGVQPCLFSFAKRTVQRNNRRQYRASASSINGTPGAPPGWLIVIACKS